MVAEGEGGASGLAGEALAAALGPERVAQGDAPAIGAFHQPADAEERAARDLEYAPGAVAAHLPEVDVVLQLLARALRAAGAVQHEAEDALVGFQADQVG